MGLILRTTSVPNTGTTVSVKGSELTWAEGDGNFAYLLTNMSGSNISITGSTTVTGLVTATGFTGSLAGTSSWATNATTASSADNFTVRGTLTAQTLVVQTITSSTDFVTGSTRFGSLPSNTHQFTGSVSITGSLTVTGSINGNFTGSLAGTSSWAQNSSTSSYSTNILGVTNYIPIFTGVNSVSTSSIKYSSGGSYSSLEFPASSITGSIANYSDISVFSNDLAALYLYSGPVNNKMSVNLQNAYGTITMLFQSGSFGIDLLSYEGFSTTNKTLTIGGFQGLVINQNGTSYFKNNLGVTGSVTSTTGFTGSLAGTASFAISSSYVSGSAAIITNLTSSNDARINSLTIGKGGGNVLTNTALGNNALNSNTTGVQNSGVGSYALFSNIGGNYNSAMGFEALYSNTNGTENSAMGYNTLRQNTTGVENSAMGFYVLRANTSGSYNSGMGTYALASNTTGTENSAFGSNALYGNTTGSYNSALGSYALTSNTIGIYNIAIGCQALSQLTTGQYNTSIGVNPSIGITTGNYNTIIGSQITAQPSSTSNNIILADGQGNIKYRWDGTQNNIYGNLAITGSLVVTGSVTATSVIETSTRTLKDNIQPYTTEVASFNRLQPVSYNWKDTNLPDVGLIAEDVNEIFPEFVAKENGEITGINYSKLSVLFINMLKQQQQQIDELKQEINILKNK